MELYIALALFFLIIIYVGWNLQKIYPSKVRGFFPKYPSQTDLRISLVSITLIAVVNLSSSFENDLEIPVKEMNRTTPFSPSYDSLYPKIAVFNNYYITGSAYLVSEEKNATTFFMALISNDQNNLLNSLAFFTISMLITIGFWNFDFKDPFSINISRWVYRIAIIFIIYALLTYFKRYLIDDFVELKTNGKYTYKYFFSFYDLVKVWFGIVLLRLSQILRNAQLLKEEQSLTI